MKDMEVKESCAKAQRGRRQVGDKKQPVARQVKVA